MGDILGNHRHFGRTDVGVLHSRRGLGDVRRHLAGNGGLLLDGGGNGGHDRVHLADDMNDLVDVAHGAARGSLDTVDPGPDVVGCLGRLQRELLDLVGHDGKSPPGLAGSGRFDGGVEGQQVGLRGDGGDGVRDLADLLRGVSELAQNSREIVDLVSRAVRRTAGTLGVAGDLVDGRGHLLRGRRDGGKVGRGLLHSGRHGRNVGAHLLGRGGDGRRLD